MRTTLHSRTWRGVAATVLTSILITASMSVAGPSTAAAPSVQVTNAVPPKPGGSYLYAPSIADNNLTVIDTDTNKVVGVQPYGAQPFVSFTNGDHSKTITANLFASSFQVRDNTTGTSHRVMLPSHPFIVVPMKDGRHFVASLADNTVIVWDSVTEKIDKTIPVWAPFWFIGSYSFLPPGAVSLELSPDDTIVYVGYGIGSINAYRLSDGREVRPRISADGFAPAWFNISPDGRHLFALNVVGDVTVIDTQSWTVIKRIPPFLAMTGSISPDGKRMFFAGLDGITVVDLDSLKVVGSVYAQGMATNVL